jgi:4-hydroxybenzoate polyprenyltransferase
MKLHTKVIFDLLRVRQWSKNFLVYAALIFTSNLFNTVDFLKTTAAFFLFCLAASSIYIMNDISDYKEDRLHSEKKTRPIASGAVQKDFAMALSAILMVISLAGSFILNAGFGIVIVVYLIINTLYTFKLKHVVILDVFILSAGYVLRAIAGAFVISVSISPWLIICTTLVTLFLALAKRRHELSLPDASKHRKILEEYSTPMLDQMINVVTASTVIAYSLYTFTSETAAKHNYMMLTIPFVLYGIFRYLYLIHKRNLGGSPELVFLKDLPMIINVILYVMSAVIIVYFIK